MSTIAYVGSQDISSITGVEGIASIEGWIDGLRVTYEVTKIGGGSSMLGLNPVYEPRDIVLAPMIEASAVSGLRDAVAAVLAYFPLDTDLQLRFADGSDRYITARRVATPIKPTAIAFLHPNVTAAMSFLARDPRFYEYSPSTITAITTTPKACACGQLPGVGVYTITNGTNPVITLKNDAGTVLGTCGFTQALGASDTIEIDTQKKTVFKTISGVKTSALPQWTSGTLFLQPYANEADYRAQDWPTLELNSGGGTMTYKNIRVWEQ